MTIQHLFARFGQQRRRGRGANTSREEVAMFETVVLAVALPAVLIAITCYVTRRA
jgi:hypothetical protein